MNSAKPLFEGLEGIKVDPEIVKLALQLVDCQRGEYDPADLDDRYQTRLRAMIDAKIKGEGVTVDEEVAPRVGNVIDLMTALKPSLGESAKAATEPAPAITQNAKSLRKVKAPSVDDIRRQPAFKLPRLDVAITIEDRKSISIVVAQLEQSEPLTPFGFWCGQLMGRNQRGSQCRLVNHLKITTSCAHAPPSACYRREGVWSLLAKKVPHGRIEHQVQIASRSFQGGKYLPRRTKRKPVEVGGFQRS